MKTLPKGLERWGRRACVAVALGCSVGALTACKDLLDVSLPAKLTDTAVNDPAGAETLRNSVINEFETAFNYVFWFNHGMEDGGEIILGSPGIDRGGFDWQPAPQAWFPIMQTSRSFAYQLHDKLEKEWTVKEVPGRAQYLAITSLYAGAALSILGGTLCEVTVDGGKLMSPKETLTLADQWLTKALTEITAAGDFALPFGIATSAQTLAYGLRAQVRWMAGDKTNALADAQRVPKGFVAKVTREAGPARRNKAYYDGTFVRYAKLYGVNDWWVGARGGGPNPVTGQPWPAVIPFTGYLYLGILPDGRAVRDDGLPIRLAGSTALPQKYRTAVENTAVADSRVKFHEGITQGEAFQSGINDRYSSEDDDVPMVNWKEMWLIRAEIEGGQKAIDLVNELRDFDKLPKVTYANPASAKDIRYLIIEERRRALFVEGRYLFTKLQNLDILWFPRGEGNQLSGRGSYGGAVRMHMPNPEYELNPNLKLSDRATGCPVNERPMRFF